MKSAKLYKLKETGDALELKSYSQTFRVWVKDEFNIRNLHPHPVHKLQKT
jgi:hypothetical protein